MVYMCVCNNHTINFPGVKRQRIVVDIVASLLHPTVYQHFFSVYLYLMTTSRYLPVPRPKNFTFMGILSAKIDILL